MDKGGAKAEGGTPAPRGVQFTGNHLTTARGRLPKYVVLIAIFT